LLHFQAKHKEKIVAKRYGVKAVGIELNRELTDNQQQIVIKLLKVLLADEAVLYIKLRNYHWNVTGTNFYPFRAPFEDQSNEIADVVDNVAERIYHYSGVSAPGAMDELIRNAHLGEEIKRYSDARTMVVNLVGDHEVIIRSLYEHIESLDEQIGHGVESELLTLLTSLLLRHQAMAWVLQIYLDG
jgi:starvation-inducible DNA-binding protein